VSTSPSRVFAARLSGLPVFDPAGDQVGKIRDLVVVLRPSGLPPRVLGLVVEVFGRRSIFVPMTRVTSIDSGQVITTGLVNMRRFEQRQTETLVFGQMLDRRVSVRDSGIEGTVYDLAMEQARNRDWVISRVALQEGSSKRFSRKGQTHVVEWRDVEGFAAPEEAQGATHLLAALEEMRPADLANVIHDLPPKRRSEIAAALDDERLADVLEELPEEDQVEILGNLDNERAADVLEEMSPDDAADLIAELPPETAEALLQLMEPEEAEDVRRLMSYEEHTAGGMMTTEPVNRRPGGSSASPTSSVCCGSRPPPWSGRRSTPTWSRSSRPRASRTSPATSRPTTWSRPRSWTRTAGWSGR
jgi:flagellar motility protein MotE (MotC chaperone)/sporulation protein YlmC with PRC-barrel domain